MLHFYEGDSWGLIICFYNIHNSTIMQYTTQTY